MIRGVAIIPLPNTRKVYPGKHYRDRGLADEVYEIEGIDEIVTFCEKSDLEIYTLSPVSGLRPWSQIVSYEAQTVGELYKSATAFNVWCAALAVEATRICSLCDVSRVVFFGFSGLFYELVKTLRRQGLQVAAPFLGVSRGVRTAMYKVLGAGS